MMQVIRSVRVRASEAERAAAIAEMEKKKAELAAHLTASEDEWKKEVSEMVSVVYIILALENISPHPVLMTSRPLPGARAGFHPLRGYYAYRRHKLR